MKYFHDYSPAIKARAQYVTALQAQHEGFLEAAFVLERAREYDAALDALGVALDERGRIFGTLGAQPYVDNN